MQPITSLKIKISSLHIKKKGRKRKKYEKYEQKEKEKKLKEKWKRKKKAEREETYKDEICYDIPFYQHLILPFHMESEMCTPLKKWE